jgi:hypothetical protein
VNISKHVTLRDVEFNEFAARMGINNTLPEELYENAELLAENILDPLIEEFKHVQITSWYRCEALEREYSKHAFLRWCSDNRKAYNAYVWQEYLSLKPHHTAQAVCLKFDEDQFEFLKTLDFTLLQKKEWISISYVADNLEKRIVV